MKSNFLFMVFVLELRYKIGSPFRAVKFHGSPHVAHLRYHQKQYSEEIEAFLAGDIKANCQSCESEK